MKWNEEVFKQAVASSLSLKEVCEKLGLAPGGGNNTTIKKTIVELGIDGSHLTRQHGKRIDGRQRKYELKEILVENSHYKSSSGLKKRLIKENLLERKCYGCSRVAWTSSIVENEVAIPLELEHINGINTDNRISNLTLLCPNCHALTSTYRGRKNGNPKVTENGHTNLCECGKPSYGKRCYLCHSKNLEKIDWPPTEWLVNELKTTTYVELAKRLGVSDSSIKKRIKNHGSEG